VFSPLKVSMQQPRWRDGQFEANAELVNRNSFTDLAGFRFHWQLRAGAADLGAAETRHTVAPGAAATLPVRLASTARPQRLLLTVFDAQGFDVVHQEFRIPHAGPSTVEELPAGGARALRLRAAKPGEILLSGADGRELLAVRGVVVSRGTGWYANQAFADASYEAARVTGQLVEVPVRIPSAGLSGWLRAQIDGARVRFSYTLRAERPIVVREAGMVVQLPTDARLTWNRDALPPEPTLASAPIAKLIHLGSLRNVLWFAAARDLFFQPLGRATNLRALAAPGEIAVSDFLGGDDFLGRFPAIEVERRIEPGKTIEGGFALRPVALEHLSDPRKDLTWPRN
jgi:hypothetical protein